MAEKLTTWEVLRNRFPAEEYVLIEEVSDASGHLRSRSLDFMLINLWQSRGLAITGIERKSNRGDWLKELKNPKKQENHFKYCDYFYLITDKDDVAKLEEIPDTWGWYHVKGNSLKTMKAAPKLPSEPVNRSFLCAMMRRAANKEKYVHIDTVLSQVSERTEQQLAQRNIEGNRAITELKELKERVDKFIEASGVDIDHGWWNYKNDNKKIGEIVKLVLNGGIGEHKEALLRLKNSADHILKTIEKQIGYFKKVE